MQFLISEGMYDCKHMNDVIKQCSIFFYSHFTYLKLISISFVAYFCSFVCALLIISINFH